MAKAPAKTNAAKFHKAIIEGEVVPDGWENFGSLPNSQRQAARDALTRHLARVQPVDIELDDQNRIVKPQGDETQMAQHLRLCETVGTGSFNYMAMAIGALKSASIETRGTNKPNPVILNGLIAMVDAIAPQDELEGALAIQMASNHRLITDLMSRAQSTDSNHLIAQYGNLAVKLQRTFTAQVEALARLRGGANQSVRVEHVHVHAGGQAVVGNVAHPGGGVGRGRRKTKGQPDAQAPDDDIPALRSPDEEGNGVSVPGDIGQEAMPDARRE